MGILQLEIPLIPLINFVSTVNGTAQITNPLIWVRILRISNPMNPFSKRIHQIKNPDLDLPKGTRNPFLDLKSVFGFTERNTPTIYRQNIKSTGSLRYVLHIQQTTINYSCQKVGFTNLEETPLNCGQQLPAPYEQLIDGLKQN